MTRAALALLVAGAAHAQIADLAVDRYVLPNGMEVLLHADHRLPVVYLNFRFRVGSKDEKAGRTGLAHLFEHMLFQTKEGPDFLSAAERMGATGAGASTYDDFTEYYETVPASRLERMLWMESNRFAQLPQNMTPENFERQRGVVINEKRQKTENEAYGRVDEATHENAFPQGHPYQHDVIGSYEDLRAITIEDAHAFYGAHYTADRLTLAIAGDFDAAQVKPWVAKYFGPMPPGDGGARPARSAPTLGAARVVHMEDRVRTERIFMVWPGPRMADRQEAALEFVEFILGDGATHLHKTLGDKLSLGTSISRIELEDASLFKVVVSLVPGVARETVEEKVHAEFARLAREPLTPAQMERSRNRLELDQAGNIETIGGVANTMQAVRGFYGGIDRWRDWASRYSSVTAEDIRAAVARWLNTPNHLTIHVRPQTARRDDTPEPDRTQPPPFQPEKPFRAPEVQSAKLPNGLPIFLVERHDLPKVAMEIRFRIGALQAPAGKPAVALLAAAAAGKETANYKDPEQAAKDLATEARGGADQSSQSMRVEVLRKNVEPALRLLADVVLRPTYPDWSIDAWRRDWLAMMEKPEPNIDAFRTPVLQVAFGAGHPYGAAGFGTAESLRSVTARDVRDFHDRYWRPDVAALIVAGDITLDEVVKLATATLGEWSGKVSAPAAPPPAKPMPGRLFVMDAKGGTQTMVAQVLPGIARASPDYLPMLLVNSVLGGMSASRLSNNIRQEKALAYFAASQLWELPGIGLWMQFSPVQNDGMGVAIREFQRELGGLAGPRPITAEEIAEAKNTLVQSFPSQFETLGSTVDSIAGTWLWGLPLDDMVTWPERIAKLTPAEVNAVARKYAQPDRAFFVLVGDRDKIKPQLEKLNLGPVTVVK